MLIGSRRCSERVLLLELLEELLHALVGEVAARALDELEHHPRAGVAVGEDLLQARGCG